MTVQSRLFRRDPDWRADRRGGGALAPAVERSWLYESGSLTQRLKRACGPAFGVRVLLEGEMPPFPGERNALGGSGAFFVREVLLHRAGVPLVAARTVIPAATLRGKHAGLAHLGNRPLGEVLFACPCLERRKLEIARVAPNTWRNPTLCGETAVWGRRSRYRIASGNLLVSEFFLPAALDLEEYPV